MESVNSGNVPAICGLTMSSLEIAGLMAKRHDHVIRDIRKMLADLGDGPFPQFWGKVPSAGGRPMDVANLPKRECLILVSGYSVELRARIIDRWLALESAIAPSAMVEDLSREVRAAIGGIVKGIVHRELTETVPAMVDAALLADPRRVALDVVSVRQILDDAKALQKGRNALNRKVGRALRDLAARTDGGVATKCPHTGVWLFQRTFAASFMREGGAAMVRSHNDAVTGQRVLNLVVPKKPGDSPAL